MANHVNNDHARITELVNLGPEHHERLVRLDANDEPQLVLPRDGSAGRGWVVVTVDLMLNLKPQVQRVYGPFPNDETAGAFARSVEENGTRVFVAPLRAPVEDQII
jgi:hypothetical protein